MQRDVFGAEEQRIRGAAARGTLWPLEEVAVVAVDTVAVDTVVAVVVAWEERTQEQMQEEASEEEERTSQIETDALLRRDCSAEKKIFPPIASSRTCCE